MSKTTIVDIQMTFATLAENNPVLVRLTDTKNTFTIPSDGITLDPNGTPGAAADPTSLAGLILGTDTVSVTAGDTANFTLTIGVNVPYGATALSGSVSIGTGATVTLSQVGNREADEIQTSKPFLISLKGVPSEAPSC